MTFLFAVGVYLLSNVLFAVTIRVLSQSNPIKNEDPLFLGTANRLYNITMIRVISNTVE